MHDALVEIQGGAGEGRPDVLLRDLAGALGRHEGLHGGEFVGCGWSGDTAAEHEGDACFVVRGGRHGFRPEGARRFHEHLIIEEREGLERAIRDVAAGDTGFTGRSVEGRGHRERCGALDEGVQRAASAILAFAGLPIDPAIGAFTGHTGWLRGEDARAAHLGGKQSRRLERTVTDEFRVEPEAATAGEQEILAIFLGEFPRDDGRLAIRATGDDEAMEFLHRPAGLYEIDGEPVE